MNRKYVNKCFIQNDITAPQYQVIDNDDEESKNGNENHKHQSSKPQIEMEITHSHDDDDADDEDDGDDDDQEEEKKIHRSDEDEEYEYSTSPTHDSSDIGDIDESLSPSNINRIQYSKSVKQKQYAQTLVIILAQNCIYS